MLLLVHFFKLDTMDAIWLTIMSNQLSGAVSLPPAPTASRLLEQSQAITEGGWRWRGAGSFDALTNDQSEEKGICRSIESLEWRSYECSDAEAWLFEFSDPLARA